MSEHGSKFFKTDLHFHTPASQCYKNKDVTVKNIIDEAINQNLEVIAITDHNDISGIEEAREYSKGRSIYVFPGIEITAKGGHILALFDLDFPLNSLNDFLPRVGITSQQRGRQTALAEDFETVLNEINKFGGLAIAAHADHKNGFLVSIQQGRHRIRIYSNTFLSGLEIYDSNNIEIYSKGSKPNYKRKIACIQSSDSHDLSEIGRRFCYLKMDKVSLEGLRQALLDHDVKIKHMTDDILLKIPFIKNIKATGGFFEGEDLGFHRNLNCIIGGKGTGKSLLIEFLRFAFEDVSIIEDIAQDHWGKIRERLGEDGKITVICEDENGTEYVIEREYDPFFESESKSKVILKLTGDETSFPFNPFFFSQGEIARISSLPLAQLELIDKYIDIDEENNEEAALISTLEQNARDIQTHYENIIKLDYVLKDKDTGKTVTEARLTKLKSGITDPILTEFPKWNEEQNYLTKLLDGIGSLEENINEFFEQMDIMSYFPTLTEDLSPNLEKLKKLDKLKKEFKVLIEDKAKSFSDYLEGKKEQIQEVIDEIRPKYLEKKEQHDAHLIGLGAEDIKKIQKQILALQTRKSDLQKKESHRHRLFNNYTKIKNDREELLGSLKKVRAARYKKRHEKSKQLEESLDNQINININAEGDREEYFQELCRLATGSHVRDKDLENIVNNIDPDVFIYATLRKESEFISSESSIEKDWADRLIAHLRTKSREDLLNLQTVSLTDLPEIRFRIDMSNWRLLDQCSIGQKSTVILSLVLVEGDEPIIIDQPEDALDSIFIYKMIVKKLRQEKEGRQYILTTHNPNILVSADSDLSFILEASAEKGKVKSRGGLDRTDTNELVLLHLEGGPDAFNLRSQKYIKINR
jgi:histidinol phosphatase-like PHP family hydrolase/predicted ATPase